MSANRAAILELAIKVESLLGDLGGEGRGIHDKLTCIEQEFDVSMVKKIRRIASIRNKAAHEIHFETDMVSFHRVAYEVIDCLELKIAAKRNSFKRESGSFTDEQQSSQNSKGSQNSSKGWSDMDWWERTQMVAGGALAVGLLIFAASK